MLAVKHTTPCRNLVDSHQESATAHQEGSKTVRGQIAYGLPGVREGERGPTRHWSNEKSVVGAGIQREAINRSRRIGWTGGRDQVPND